MLAFLWLCQIVLVSAFCTDVALWVPWKDETVDMAANALHLKNYDKFVELNPDFNTDSVQRGKTYTVPFTVVDPPATWVKTGGCTPLLVLNTDASTISTWKTSKIQQTSTPSTLETRRQNTLTNTEGRTTTAALTKEARKSTETPPAESEPNTKITSALSVSKTSSASAFLDATELETHLSEKYSLTVTQLSSRISNTVTVTNISTYSSNPTTLTKSDVYTKQSETPSSESDSLTFHTPYSPTSQILGQTEFVTETTTATTTQITTKTTTETDITTTTTTANLSTATTLVCHPDGSQGPSGYHNTDESKLEKYATKFCKAIDGVSLTEKFQSVQLIYGQSTALYIFTVSWMPGCKGDQQSITGAGSLCYNTIMEDWRSCNNKGQGGYKTKGCVMWMYRPGAIEDADE
jgi:hypothetical protein